MKRFEMNLDNQIAFSPQQGPDGVFSFFVSSFRGCVAVQNMQVYRVKTNTVLWDTSIGGLMFSDQYVQIAAYLPTRYIYGIGEHNRASFMVSTRKC
jgi:hypothetical protein